MAAPAPQTQPLTALPGMQHLPVLGQLHAAMQVGLPIGGMVMKMPMAVPADWTLEEDTILENTLAECWEASDRLEKAAARLPHRSIEAVRHRFKLLEEDVANIDAGRIPLPSYASAQETNSMERRKGIPWTEEEHRLFLMGLAKFGKGDWRSISRNYVISRTPTQVASHAQKYFIRLNSMNKKDKRRSSIHDITSPGGNTGEVTGLMPHLQHQPPLMPPGGVMGAVMPQLGQPGLPQLAPGQAFALAHPAVRPPPPQGK